MDLLKHIVDASPDEKSFNVDHDIFEIQAGMDASQAGDIMTENPGLADGGVKTVHFNIDAQDGEGTCKTDNARDTNTGNVDSNGLSLVKKRHKKTKHRQKEHRREEQIDPEQDPGVQTSDTGMNDAPDESDGLDDTLESTGSEKVHVKNKHRKKKSRRKPNPVPGETVDPLVVKYYELNEILKQDFIERKQLANNQPQHMQHMFRQYVEAVRNRPPPAPCVQKGMITNTTKRLIHRAAVENRNILQRNPPEKDNTSTDRKNVSSRGEKMGSGNINQVRSAESNSRSKLHVVRKPRPQSAVVGRHSRTQTISGNRSVVRRSRSAGSGRSSGAMGRRRRSLDSPRSETQSSVKSRDTTESSSTPRRINVPTDCFLKHTDDENIREWLDKKNQLLKMERAAKRAKRREQRAAQMDETTRRYDMQVLSKLETEEWMERKRKEAWRKVKEEKVKKVLAAREEAEELELKRQKLKMLHEKLLNPPVMSHHKRGKTEQPEKIKRMTINDEQLKGGETSDDVRHQLETDRLRNEEEEQSEKATKINEDGPPLPKTKFIYKRPVTGKIRFKMSKSKSLDGGTCKQTNGRDKNKQARMSYDQWLVKKRADDIEKRKIEQAKCRNLAGSDPELERIIPEMAKRRMGKILEQKKKIDTGIKDTDHNLNAAFGGGDKRENSYQTDGGHSNRPQSAPSRSNVHTKPKISLNSPRRVQTRLETVMEKEETANPYKLPFPPDQGVPRYVAAKQRKIFAEGIWKMQEEERPEPQGCEPSASNPESQFEKTADVIIMDPSEDKPVGESNPCDDRDTEDQTNSGRYGFKKGPTSDSDSSIDEEINDEKEEFKDSVSDTSKQNDLNCEPTSDTADSFFLTSVEI